MLILSSGMFCRIAVTLVSDPGANLVWRDVREVVIGRIRNTREYKSSENGDMSILSLSLLPGQFMTIDMDERSVSDSFSGEINGRAVVQYYVSKNSKLFNKIDTMG